MSRNDANTQMCRETALLYAGYRHDPVTKAVSVPIYQSTAYELDGDLEKIAGIYNVKEDGFTYSRIINPTTRILEKRFAAVEGGSDSLAVASGQAATFLAIANLCSGTPGDNVVASKYLYGNSWNLLFNTLKRLGIEARSADPKDISSFELLIDDRTIAIFGEAFSNPCLVPLPIPELAGIGKGHGVPVIVDNTTTPLMCRPTSLGASISTYSATKYLCGHGTTLGGLIVDNGRFAFADAARFPLFNGPDEAHGGVLWKEAVRKLDDLGASPYLLKARMTWLRDTGAAISPFSSFQLIQGLETLHLRMQRHCENAMAIAEFLKNHPKVKRVSYPSLSSGYERELVDELIDASVGYGAIIMFELMDEAAGRRFITNIELMYHVSNVGDARTLITHPVSTTHTTVPKEQREAAGIFDGSIRLCVGIENIDDIVADIQRGPDAV